MLGAESTPFYLGVRVAAAGVGEGTCKRFRDNFDRLVEWALLKPRRKWKVDEVLYCRGGGID